MEVVFRETFRKQFKEENPDVKGVTAVIILYSPVAFMNVITCTVLSISLYPTKFEISFPRPQVSMLDVIQLSVVYLGRWRSRFTLDLECVVCTWHGFGMMHVFWLVQSAKAGGERWLQLTEEVSEVTRYNLQIGVMISLWKPYFVSWRLLIFVCGFCLSFNVQEKAPYMAEVIVRKAQYEKAMAAYKVCTWSHSYQVMLCYVM